MGKRQVRLTIKEAATKLSSNDLPVAVQVVMKSGITHFGTLKNLDVNGLSMELPLNKNLHLAAVNIEELVFDIETSD